MSRLDEIVEGLRSADDDVLEAARKALAREAVVEWLPRLRELLAADGDPGFGREPGSDSDAGAASDPCSVPNPGPGSDPVPASHPSAVSESASPPGSGLGFASGAAPGSAHGSDPGSDSGRAPDPDVRDAAAAAVARLAGAAALPDLLAASRAAETAGDDTDAIDALLVGLVEAAPAAAEPTLRAWLADDDERTRRTAARLWGCGDLPAGPLVAATTDPSPAVRAAATNSCAAWAISGEPPPAVVNAVLARTSDADAAVRAAAALTLAAFPDAACARRLRELAGDPDERVRAVAAPVRAR